MFAQVEQPGIGRYLMPGLPVEFGAFEREMPRRAPELGEHTDEILAEIGYSPAEIAALRETGAAR